MHHPAETRAGLSLLPLFSALLWGAVEFFALARSRRALRTHEDRHA
ncbi:MAG: hypothetical protein ABW220_11835 [Burkholderiaceae bacterium]